MDPSPPPKKPNESDCDYQRRVEFVAWREAGGRPEVPSPMVRPSRIRAVKPPRPGPRTPPSAETRAKMAAAKRGLAGQRSRPCVLVVLGRGELAFESATDAARFVGATQQAMHAWLTGTTPWPGTGPRPPRNPALAGLAGWFIERHQFFDYSPGFPSPEPPKIAPPKSEPKRQQPSHLDRSRRYVEVELTLEGQEPERFVSVHDAAKRAGVRHLTAYLWLTGERPWPPGLTGRAITPL